MIADVGLSTCNELCHIYNSSCVVSSMCCDEADVSVPHVERFSSRILEVEVRPVPSDMERPVLELPAVRIQRQTDADDT